MRDALLEVYGGPNLTEQIILRGASSLSRELTAIIVRRNRWSSFRMASENLLTASPLNNARYLLAKLRKRRQN